MTTLDGVERTFSSDMALVCDAEGPSGIAGVMGGQISEVSDSTTRVLMEAATWVGPNIMRTSKALGLRTRGLGALREAAAPGAGDRGAAPGRPADGGALRSAAGAGHDRRLPAPGRAARGGAAGRAHGAPARRAHRGGRRPAGSSSGSGFARSRRRLAVVPPWRDSDVQREADLIEEVARIHGLDKLPTTLPAREQAIGRLTRQPAAAPPAGGPAARPRPARGDLVQLHLARGARAPAPDRRRAAPRSRTRSART